MSDEDIASIEMSAAESTRATIYEDGAVLFWRPDLGGGIHLTRDEWERLTVARGAALAAWRTRPAGPTKEDDRGE